MDGLVGRWDPLARYFEVPLSDRSKWTQGNEPGKLLDWLTERRRVWALRDAFNALEWDDLIEVLEKNP
jgi:hypothetical protein